jgi:acetyl-CoA carboxylase biotin carboxyl carrier protein
MKITEIRQLVKLMVDNDLSELDITDGQTKVLLKRGREPVVVAAPPGAGAALAEGASAAGGPGASKPGEELLEIKSPMVGTFYSAPSPDSDSYVSVGEHVNDESVVSIIEAMKVMNEIKAECSGTIAEVCVKNAQPVEFGQVLFRVRPA